MLEESKKSFFPEKVKKMNEFAEKNPWLKFFLWFSPLVTLTWKILVWVYEKILPGLWEKLKEANLSTWSKKESVVFLCLTYFIIFTVIEAYLLLLIRNRIYHRKRERAKLNCFHKELEKKLKWINREMEKIMIKMKEAEQNKRD